MTTSPCVGKMTSPVIGAFEVANRDWTWIIWSSIWLDASEINERCTRLTRAKPVKARTPAMARTKNSVKRARIES